MCLGSPTNLKEIKLGISNFWNSNLKESPDGMQAIKCCTFNDLADALSMLQLARIQMALQLTARTIRAEASRKPTNSSPKPPREKRGDYVVLLLLPLPGMACHAIGAGLLDATFG